MTITNPQILGHKFLEGMYSDDYFPKFLVDECKQILLEICERMEAEKPKDADGVYALTRAATQQLNELEDAFYAADSEIETAARECLAEDIEFIMTAYGWDLDLETAIDNRDW